MFFGLFMLMFLYLHICLFVYTHRLLFFCLFICLFITYKYLFSYVFVYLYILGFGGINIYLYIKISRTKIASTNNQSSNLIEP